MVAGFCRQSDAKRIAMMTPLAVLPRGEQKRYTMELGSGQPALCMGHGRPAQRVPSRSVEMTESNSPNHWDSLASNLGATPPPEETQRQPGPPPAHSLRCPRFTRRATSAQRKRRHQPERRTGTRWRTNWDFPRRRRRQLRQPRLRRRRFRQWRVRRQRRPPRTKRGDGCGGRSPGGIAELLRRAI